jgi:hypothetical protein
MKQLARHPRRDVRVYKQAAWKKQEERGCSTDKRRLAWGE